MAEEAVEISRSVKETRQKLVSKQTRYEVDSTGISEVTQIRQDCSLPVKEPRFLPTPVAGLVVTGSMATALSRNVHTVHASAAVLSQCSLDPYTQVRKSFRKDVHSSGRYVDELARNFGVRASQATVTASERGIIDEGLH